MEGQLPSGVPRIFMPADRVVASAVEKKIFKIAPAPRPGATTLPPMFLNPPSAARRVNYRYYVFNIIRYPVSPDREPSLTEPNRPRLAEEGDNQFITAGASAHLHTREDDPSLFSHSPRGYSRPITNCRAETRCKFESLSIANADWEKQRRTSEYSSHGAIPRFRRYFANRRIFLFFCEARRSIGGFLLNKVMTLPARNRNVYKRFVAFINHERDKGRGTEIAFT